MKSRTRAKSARNPEAAKMVVLSMVGVSFSCASVYDVGYDYDLDFVDVKSKQLIWRGSINTLIVPGS